MYRAWTVGLNRSILTGNKANLLKAVGAKNEAAASKILVQLDGDIGERARSRVTQRYFAGVRPRCCVVASREGHGQCKSLNVDEKVVPAGPCVSPRVPCFVCLHGLTCRRCCSEAHVQIGSP